MRFRKVFSSRHPRLSRWSTKRSTAVRWLGDTTSRGFAVRWSGVSLHLTGSCCVGGSLPEPMVAALLDLPSAASCPGATHEMSAFSEAKTEKLLKRKEGKVRFSVVGWRYPRSPTSDGRGVCGSCANGSFVAFKTGWHRFVFRASLHTPDESLIQHS